MTLRDALRTGARILAATREAAETPFLDASILLASILGLSRDRLLAASGEELPEEARSRFEAALSLRAAGKPVAYLTGQKEFYGHVFRVDERVLVPRPDTELLVEAALKAGELFLRERDSARENRDSGDSARENGAAGDSARAQLRVHEACVGSGCVILSIGLERPDWQISASDLSPGALDVAAGNSEALLAADRPGGALSLRESDLLASVPGTFDLIVANPPYVSSSLTDELLSRGWGEPRLALDGGTDGLDCCRRLVPEAAGRLAPGGFLLVEAGEEQAGELGALFAASGFIGIESLRDLAGAPRVTQGRLPWKK